MSPSLSHNRAAEKIARERDAEYIRGEGADICTPHTTIEVETAQTVEEGLTQLQGYRGPVYIAGSNQEAVENALEVTEGTTVGVMNRRGEILRSSSRSW